MTSLRQRIIDGVTKLSTEIKATKVLIGTLASLSTTNKNSIVEAINELKASGVTMVEVNQAIANVVGTAPAALDTLQEIASVLQAEQASTGAILTALARRVSLDAASYSAAEQLQVRSNIGAIAADAIGDPDTDFVAIINAALQ
jgi:hypothetical protein